MNTFKTSSGAEYPCELFATIPTMGVAYIGVPSKHFTWASASALFSNEEEMAHLEYAGNKVDGYTHLDYIVMESYGFKAQLSIPR